MRPDLSKVGNRVLTTIALLPRVCLSVIGQDRSHDPKVSQCRIKDVHGSGRGVMCHTVSSQINVSLNIADTVDLNI